jgi:Domain of unknown function (DUF932)
MTNIITLDQLRSQLPQAFATAPAARVSARYSFIPTSQILTDLDTLGWKIRSITNPRYKSEGKQLHGKHLVRLFNPDIQINSEGDVNNVEIALYNSSDGTSKFRMEVGIFRMVCSNGLVVKSQDFGGINMRHSGYSFEALRTSIEEMIAGLPNVVTKINTFAARQLTAAEMTQLAQGAYSLRNSGRVATEEELHAILTPRRDADRPNNLWTVFNRVQEAILTGGSLLVDARGRMRSAKPIVSLDKGLKLNQELWQLAEQMA